MAFCINCGAQLPEGSNFCPNCGNSISTIGAQSEEIKSIIINNEVKGALHDKETRKSFLSFVFISIIVVCIAILVITINEDNNTEQIKTVSNNEKSTSVIIKEESKFKPIKSIISNWEITINDFEYKDFVDAGLLFGYEAADNSTYCIIDLSIKNIGTEVDTFLPLIAFDNESNAKLIFGDYEYTRTELILADDNLIYDTLNPLTKVSGSIVFEVPKFMKNSTAYPRLVFTQDNEIFECELSK